MISGASRPRSDMIQADDSGGSVVWRRRISRYEADDGRCGTALITSVEWSMMAQWMIKPTSSIRTKSLET